MVCWDWVRSGFGLEGGVEAIFGIGWVVYDVGLGEKGYWCILRGSRISWTDIECSLSGGAEGLQYALGKFRVREV